MHPARPDTRWAWPKAAAKTQQCVSIRKSARSTQFAPGQEAEGWFPANGLAHNPLMIASSCRKRNRELNGGSGLSPLLGLPARVGLTGCNDSDSS